MNGTLLNTVTFSEMTDLVRKTFVTVQGMVVPVAQQLYITEPIPNGNGNTKRFDELDTETYARLKREGEAASKVRVGVGYNKTMTKKRIAAEIDITQEMRDENRYSEVGSLITNLAHYCPQRIELDLTHRLTFASSTSYTDIDGQTVATTTGDGLALLSASHTLKHSSSTYSNRVSGDPVFSRGALEAAEQLMTTDIKSNFGERRVMNFNVIITGDNPTTKNAVKQFLQSTADVDQDNSGVLNIYRGSYRHVVLPMLATTAAGAPDSTKKHWWFVASVGQGAANSWQAYYGVWEAPNMKIMPAEGNSGSNYHTDTWSYGVRAGYGIVTVSGRGIIGSLPTSS